MNRGDTSSVRAARGDFVFKVGRLTKTRAPFFCPIFWQPETFTDTSPQYRHTGSQVLSLLALLVQKYKY
jgi:hypothetical protein